MTKVLKRYTIPLILFLFVSSHVVRAAPKGYLSGQLFLDASWDTVLYVSLIERIEKEYSISNETIIAQSTIDSDGYFNIQLDKIPTQWSLLRLHVVKKGDPPASLIIGSSDENYCFLVANRHSTIELVNTPGKPLFGDVAYSKASDMQTFQYICELSSYTSTINYDSSLVEKAFVEEVVTEKLKSIADTSQNPLIALYALYQIDFQKDAQQDPDFYERFLSRWDQEHGAHFTSFKKQLPRTSNASSWLYYLLFFIGALLILVVVLAVNKKYRRSKKIDMLSVQERKILDMIQKGASNKEISNEFHIGLSTVKSHVSSIYTKLEIKSRKEAMSIKVK